MPPLLITTLVTNLSQQLVALHRRLLVPGLTSRIKQIQQRPDKFDSRFAERLDCKLPKLAAVAMANKTARIIWALLTREQDCQLRTA